MRPPSWAPSNGWNVCDGSGVDDDGVGGDRHGVGAAGDMDLAFAGELGVAVDQQHRVEVGEHRVVLLPHRPVEGVAAFDGLRRVFVDVVIGAFVLGVVDEDLRGDAGRMSDAQAPITSSPTCSMTATFLPARAIVPASVLPPLPQPMTRRSGRLPCESDPVGAEEEEWFRARWPAVSLCLWSMLCPFESVPVTVLRPLMLPDGCEVLVA